MSGEHDGALDALAAEREPRLLPPGPARPPGVWRNGGRLLLLIAQASSSPGSPMRSYTRQHQVDRLGGDPRRRARYCTYHVNRCLKRRVTITSGSESCRSLASAARHLGSRPFPASPCRGHQVERLPAQLQRHAAVLGGGRAMALHSSRLRVSSNRLTCCRRRPGCRAGTESAMAQLSQRGSHPRILGVERVSGGVARPDSSPPARLAGEAWPAQARRRCCRWT